MNVFQKLKDAALIGVDRTLKSIYRYKNLIKGVDIYIRGKEKHITLVCI